MKSVIGVAFCHTSSSRRPSTRIDPFGTRVAVACLRLAALLAVDCANAADANNRQTTATPAIRMSSGSVMDLDGFHAAAINREGGLELRSVGRILDANENIAVRYLRVIELSAA